MASLSGNENESFTFTIDRKISEVYRKSEWSTEDAISDFCALHGVSEDDVSVLWNGDNPPCVMDDSEIPDSLGPVDDDTPSVTVEDVFGRLATRRKPS